MFDFLFQLTALSSSQTQSTSNQQFAVEGVTLVPVITHCICPPNYNFKM